MNILMETTIYVRKLDSSIDELCLIVFEPISEERHFAIRIRVTRNQEDALVDRSVCGADRWQAIMLGIAFLRLRLALIIKKSYTSIHYSRQSGEEGKEMGLDLLFPIAYDT